MSNTQELNLARLRIICQVVWIGSLWTIGLMVTPVLFSVLDKVVAGEIAGKLFAYEAYIGVLCGAILIVESIARQKTQAFQSLTFWFLLVMFALTLVNHWMVTPIIVEIKQSGQANVASGLFGGGFATWHAVSSAVYLLESILALCYLCRFEKSK